MLAFNEILARSYGDKVQQKFDVYFSGEILEGQDIQQVRAAVGKLFRLSGAKLDALFCGETKRIKKGLDVDQSGRFREVFREAGAIVQIVVAGQKPPTPPQVSPSAEKTASGLQLAPMGSSLSAQPRDVESTTPLATPATGELEIAPIGPLSSASSPPPANIDTSSLQVESATSGSLEEFSATVEPAPLPDISSLEIAQDDKPIEEARQEIGESIPDTGHLEAVPPNTGSMEKFAQHKKPVPIPDISDLSLDN